MPTDSDAEPLRWAAVVVNYEGGDRLVGCVRSIVADTSAGPVEVVVVDNGSSDGSIDALRAAIPGASVVRAPGNVGYARAANLGIAATRAPVVAVLNVDTVVEAGAAKVLLDRLDREARLGAVGPQLRNPDGTSYPSSRTMPSIPVAVGHAVVGLWKPDNRFTTRYRQLDADPTVPRLVDVVSGAAIWLRRAALDDVGGWDERYFMFLEDVDVCREITTAGDRVRYEPAAVVTHVVGASRSRAPVRSVVAHHRAAYRYLDKWWTGPRRLALPAAAGFLGARAAVSATGAAVTGRVHGAVPDAS